MGRFNQDATDTVLKRWENGMSEQDILDSLDLPADQIEILPLPDPEDEYREDSGSTPDYRQWVSTSDGMIDFCNPPDSLTSLPFEQW